MEPVTLSKPNQSNDLDFVDIPTIDDYVKNVEASEIKVAQVNGENAEKLEHGNCCPQFCFIPEICCCAAAIYGAFRLLEDYF